MSPSVEPPPNKFRSAPLEQTATQSTPINAPQTPNGFSNQVMPWLRRLGWTVAFTGTAIASALGGALFATSVPLPGWLAHKAAEPLNLGELWQSGFRYQVTRPVNILVMGVDIPEPGDEDADTLFSGRSDTILIVRINPEDSTVNLLSIPRDTQVDIPGEGVAKINHANLAGGPELVAQTIQTNLGPVPIDRYVRVSTGALRELVDLLGGVEVRVPHRMVYTDETQGLNINLDEGWQTLNGDQAEQFARYRGDSIGDIGRVQRQQILMKALRERLTHPTVIPRLPQVMRVMMQYVDTNLTLEETLALANMGMEIEPNDLQMVMLPGRFSTPDEYIASYWVLDPSATQGIMNRFFQLDDVALLTSRDDQTITSIPIAVQNASGEPQVAGDVAQYLRQEGFQNVYTISDWSSEIQRTQVVAQRGDLRSAGIVASILEVGRVVADSTGDLQSELTIRVGRDWLIVAPEED
ncbi:LCP family protein [Oscillatoria sp. CS-180]|uniref:LCP family protein n=1 Tax=Oscillatoria sp. CS-180 TaxID=3021720 RepID=UPI00232D23D2|nr:LCP family protein [Oscillatoria sp. CS-180]MDB9527447.1 LCP family protein [Oscillatoria sp. CS-180]